VAVTIQCPPRLTEVVVGLTVRPRITEAGNQVARLGVSKWNIAQKIFCSSVFHVPVCSPNLVLPRLVTYYQTLQACMHGNLARQELANKDYFGRYSMESMGGILMRRVPGNDRWFLRLQATTRARSNYRSHQTLNTTLSVSRVLQSQFTAELKSNTLLFRSPCEYHVSANRWLIRIQSRSPFREEKDMVVRDRKLEWLINTQDKDLRCLVSPS